MKKIGIPLLIIIALVLLFVFRLISVSNQMTTQKNAVDSQLATVATQLQRRADLIPNLVVSVQGDQAQEQSITDSITAARAGYDKASTTNDKVAALQQQASAISSGINVLVEAYPQLNSSNNVTNLMVQLEGTENRIATERKNYNDIATSYNNLVSTFPNNVIAGLTGHSAVKYFEADSTSSEAPKVDFSSSSNVSSVVTD
jgi:LemA protein